ncbi:MAG: phosphate ABC transporter permease PstA [Nitrososphaerota archaeon]|nr:phosphate ABC transporter permease PstA [Nitrososphaerota archaeon]MDG6967295.1 phosphate ABC transporter permease PstA [Nitrososphaerota archaeon]MDG6977926.1 phosphate ABC transporter permease PstA [Nitrososphaerota archaeon]MDG7005845.1 phosphate ABC transporter permease PstA [Nitrososphaerota archaeon]MDG7020840.1 phosphate ABC transporter permease PstA [Nitrososphaerota archaeon]
MASDDGVATARGVRATGSGQIWKSPSVVSNHRRRVLKDRLAKGLAAACLLAVLVPLADMLYMFAYRGLQVISIEKLTTITVGSASFVSGGLANAIVGTLLLIALASLITVPLGLLGGVYMAEFSDHRLSEALRFAADVLAGNSSIVLGYVGYLVFVLYFGWGYSALAGALTLSILMFPYVFRTTELAMRKVPSSIKEAAIALGSTKSTMINRVVLRFALPGIATGVLLAIGIGLSETAPLLYTASFSNYLPNGALTHNPVGYLTYVVYVYSQLPSNAAHNLAYLSSFILIAIVLGLNVVARVALRRVSKV